MHLMIEISQTMQQRLTNGGSEAGREQRNDLRRNSWHRQRMTCQNNAPLAERAVRHLRNRVAHRKACKNDRAYLCFA